MVIGTPQVLTAASTAIDREFFDYYRTPRGQHPRATTAFSRTSGAPMMLFWSYQHLDWISPRPVLFITGDQAHSRIFSEHAYSRASEPKELFIVPGAGHVDLYDRVKPHSVGEASVVLRQASRRREGGIIEPVTGRSFCERTGAARWIPAKRDTSQERWHS